MSCYKMCLSQDDNFCVGDEVYVAEGYDTEGKRGFGPAPVTGEIRRTPFLTNLGGQELLHGWLGTSFGMCETALGVGVVVDCERYDGDRFYGEKYRVRIIRKGSATEAAIVERLGAATVSD